MSDSLLLGAQRAKSPLRAYLVLVAGLVALTAGLGAFVLAESGLVPGVQLRISEEMRLVLGAHGAILFVVGTLLVTRTRGRGARRNVQQSDFYKFYGLKDLRPGDELQNFDPAASANPVQALWADSATDSRICARLDKNGRFLRVEFINERRARPCSVSIRTMGEAALVNARRYLQFEARVPTCEPRHTRPGSPKFRDEAQELAGAPKRAQSVALTLRVVNGLLQHWAWQGRAKAPKQWVVAGQGWKTFKMPLNEGWTRHSGEGNPGGPVKPDLSVLAAVVFEIGAEGEFPDGAYGVVDIRDIRCAD